MMNLQPSIQRVCVVINENKIIEMYCKCLDENHVPYENGFIIETGLDLDIIDLVGNYKLVGGSLIELSENEKPIPQPNEPSLEGKITLLEEQLALQEESTLDIDYRVTCIELGI